MDLRLSELFERQTELYKKHEGHWDPHEPSKGRDYLLWAFNELGEAAAILKKKGDQAVMENEHVRAHFAEELCDVLMYLIDAADCYDITGEDLSEAFEKKWRRNMGRTWAENDSLYED